MGFKIINIISSKGVPKWGNAKKYIAVHYLGVDGQNNDLAPDGTGAHYYIYWDGTIYQRCSHDAIVYQVGTAGVYTQKHPLARNANCIGIEMCCHCDGNKALASDPKWYFTKETQEACVWLVQKLMKELGIPAANVLRHFDIVNKTCPAPYVHNNKYKTSWTWEEFKSRIIGASLTLYRVRMAWDKPETQLNAYYDLELAKKEADTHPGFSVYNEQGAVVYKSSAQPQPGEYTPEQWIDMIAPIAQEIAKKHAILPSVVIAQTSLETGWGKTDLAKKCNIVGMKADLINGTWKDFSTWTGRTYTKESPEVENGKTVMRKSVFRVYDSFSQCLYDYAGFLLHVRNDKGLKYARLQGLTDPAKVIRIIRIGTGTPDKPEGYCTDTAYEIKILNLIGKYNLTQYDSAMPENPQPAPQPDPQPIGTMYRVQVEADRSLEAAQKTITYIWEATKWKEKWQCFAEKSDGWWKVICGSFFDKKNAEARKEAIIQRFAAKGLYQDTFITEIKT